MFRKLQSKWQVTPLRFVLILITFAVGGSLSGMIGKLVMSQFNFNQKVITIPLYILVVTLAWPICVLVVSVFTGQLTFFRKYLVKLGMKMRILRSFPATSLSQNSPNSTKLAIFASGAGSNAQKIIDHFKNNPVINISLIVCNKPDAGVIRLAANENIPVLLIEKEKFFRGDAYIPELKQAGIDFIVLAGFLWKVPDALIAAYPDKIINIHPALLPKYGGKGMYGMNVHQAVINNKETESGITIHYVNQYYDEGKIIFQASCPVAETDTPESLASKIHQLEYQHFPIVIENLLK